MVHGPASSSKGMPHWLASVRLCWLVGTPLKRRPFLTSSPTASMKKRVVDPVPRPITPASGRSWSAASAARFFAASSLMWETLTSSRLAGGAVMRGARRDHHALDGALAHEARFAFARVHLALVLVTAVRSIWIHVVANARAASFDRSFHDALGRRDDRVALACGDAARAACGANLGQEQRFVRVDVADTGDHA